MEERKDICEGYERDSVQQLDKLAKDKNERFPIYPLTYIQAVYDARTKERLDSILWKCNNVYLPWMGSAGDTRIQLPFWMRRKGIIITYKNLDDETITEKLTYDLCIADDFFRLDSSWTRITDALPVGGNITIGSNGNWFQDGVDTGFKAQGPKGDNGLTPMLRTVNNKLRYSYDGEVWYEISEYIAAWFRYQDNKIQISRDQKTWSDLSKPFTQDLYIKGYVATSSALPSTGVKQGDIYMVGPTYAAEDTEHKNPIYRMYVYNDSGWVDNGVFQSIAAGVVQTIGNSETEVMSQKAVSSIVGLDTYPVFSDTKPYVKGEIVNYGGLLYEFTADHEAGAWIGTDARETSLRGEVTNIINNCYQEVFVTYSNAHITDGIDKSTIKLSKHCRIALSQNRILYIVGDSDITYELNDFEALYIDLSLYPKNFRNDQDKPIPIQKSNYTDRSFIFTPDILVLFYRNKTNVSGGCIYNHIRLKEQKENFNQNSFLITEHKIGIVNLIDSSNVDMYGVVRLFVGNNRSFYINSEGLKRITLNDFQIAYVDISDIPANYSGKMDNLQEIKIDFYEHLDSLEKKIVLAYRDNHKVVNGLLVNAQSKDFVYNYIITQQSANIIKESSTQSYVKTFGTIRIFNDEKNFYIADENGLEITLNDFEAIFVDLNDAPYKGTTDNLVTIQKSKYSDGSFYENGKIILLYRDGISLKGGLLYDFLKNYNAESRIGDLIEDISLSLTEGYYININGNVYKSSTSDVSYSFPIKLLKGETIIVNAGGSNVHSIISITDENGTFYKSVAAGNGAFGKFTYTAIEDCYIAISFTNSVRNTCRKYLFKSSNDNTSNVNVYFKENVTGVPIAYEAKEGVLVYQGDTKSSDNYIVNAVMYPNGEIIATRSGGKVVKIGYDGETELLNISGATDWRGVYMDSKLNVFISPYDSYSNISSSERGVYKLKYGDSSFKQVLKLYNPNSDIPTESEDNRDTVWTFCEDDKGNLYAGVYSLSHENPSIYKSTDGGDTWKHIINFNDSGYTSNGRHIHSIIFNKYNRSLYVIVGEVNTIFKSVDGGNTWIDLNITLTVKGSAMLATPYGILVGSDGPFHCDIDLIYSDDKTHRKVSRIWANTVFAIRQSDVTDNIYAFTKIDSSVNALSYFPPIEAISDSEVLQNWKDTQSANTVRDWQNYHDSVVNFYPEDAIRPQHCSILVSKDMGLTWEILHKEFVTSSQAAGHWTTGYFRNGECLTGFLDKTRKFINPLIISEGKHKFTSDGIDLDGDILIKTNTSNLIDITTKKINY